MISTKVDRPFRIGLFLVVLSWFVYTSYDDIMGIFNRHVTLPLVNEDIIGTFGQGFAVAASAIAVLIVLFYVVRRDLSKPEVMMAIRLILFLESVYFVLSFLPAVFVEGLPGTARFTVTKIFELTIPCLTEATAVPVVLAKLFLVLNPNKPAKEAMKWGLISGVVYLFVFWINNAGFWVGTVIAKGISYITLYPVNLFSFVLTTIGLLLLSFYVAYFSKKTIGHDTLTRFDLKKVGFILTALGMYLTLTLLLYFFFGAVGGWSAWYAWFLGHGYLDLWGLTLPFIGLPLLFYSGSNGEVAAPSHRPNPTRSLKRLQLNLLLFVTEGLGMIFYGVLSAAYYIPIPSTKVLTGEPIFHSLISIFGLLYFISVIIILIFSAITKAED